MNLKETFITLDSNKKVNLWPQRPGKSRLKKGTRLFSVFGNAPFADVVQLFKKNPDKHFQIKEVTNW